MDNQKDFIHIDDLFKKLRHGEESERSGAWLHMKDILDKEMPLGTSVSAGRSFRRYLIPVLAAVLMAGGGLTYYGLSKNKEAQKTNPAMAINTPVSSSTGTDAGHRLAANGTQKNRSGKEEPMTGGAKQASGTGQPARKTTSGTAAETAANTTAANTTRKEQRTGLQQADKAVARHTSGSGTVATGTTTGKQSLAPKGNRGSGATTAAATTKSGGANRVSGKHSAVPVIERKDELKEEQRMIDQVRPGHNSTAAATAGKEPDRDKRSYASGNTGTKYAPLSPNDKKIVRDDKGNLFKEQRDTIKRIDLVERLVAQDKQNGGQGYTTRMDTVAVTRFEKVRYVPLDQLELISLRKAAVGTPTAKVMPSASLGERTLSRKEIVSLVPLNQYKVASRRVDPGKFNQLVQNTSQGISNYFDGSRNFYAAVMIGGNASFGNPGAFGMQFGIAGLYSLSERLTLAAELKYVNHYFSNYTVEDQSVTFENVNGQQMGGAQWLFSGTQNTTTSAYKINSFSALEMPVTLSYSLGRLSIFAGANIAYAFPIQWNKTTTFNTTNVQQTQEQNQNPFREAYFKLNEQKDFESRLGLGYVWGANYEISRKISLDVRVNQILWDNSGSNTDAVSRLLHIPTMQFSLGYYFGRKDKVIYIMDKR